MTPAPAYRRISADQALDLLETLGTGSGKAVLFDIRDPDTFAEGHHPNALPLSEASLPGYLATIDKSSTLLVCCYHGNSSQGAASFLADLGFASSCSIDGGWDDLATAMSRRSGGQEAKID